MADAKKCDRCGDYYESNCVRKVSGYFGGLKLGYIQILSVQDTSAYIFDLCDKCMDELFEFMNVREAINETTNT